VLEEEKEQAAFSAFLQNWPSFVHTKGFKISRQKKTSCGPQKGF